MTERESVAATNTEQGKAPVLFVQISEELDAQITEAAKRAGLSKSGLARLSLPLGIRRFEEMHGLETQSCAEN